MKKYLLAAAVVAVALAVPTAFGASTPKLTGGGSSPGADANKNVAFTLNATAQGTVSDAKGSVTFSRADGTFSGTVNCYNQSGNVGWASGPITYADGGFTGQVGQYFVVGVQDNGQGGTATQPDMVQVDIQPPSANLCATYPAGPSGWFPYAITSGNFQIH
jgi:hypothetical protein